MARSKIDEWITKVGKRFGLTPLPELPKRRKLTTAEAEWLADYFHNEENCPDYDGYTSHLTLPKEVMVIYIKKYGDVRGWND
jgi:hypothetical protein